MFKDDSGRAWRAFEVSRTTLASKRADLLPATHADGWLTFESGDERRRLAPCPSQWEALPLVELQALLQQATTVAPRRHRIPPNRGPETPPNSPRAEA